MNIELPDDPKECIDCNKKIPEGPQYRFGKDMWHFFNWTCGHEKTLVCPECYKLHGHHKCSKCNCKMSFT